MNIKKEIKKLKQTLPAVFLVLKDKDTPLIPKIIAGITITYALSPIDLIPDFIPILGYLDDAIVLPLLITLTIKLIPLEVWNKNLELSKDIWKEGNPKKWYFAIPIVLIWILIIYIILKLLYF